MSRAGWVALVALAAAACKLEPTEVLVTVDTSFGVPCTIDSLHIEVAGRGEPVVQDIAIDGDDLPGSIAVVPAGEPGELTVTVTGMRAGAPFATGRSTVELLDRVTLELRFLLDRACVPGPCPAVGVGEFAGLPEPAARRGCGADGYRQVGSVFEVRDACGLDEAPPSVLPRADEAEAPSPLDPPIPFPFHVYGAPVSQLWVGSNGYVAFGADQPDALTRDVGPSRTLGEAGFPTVGVLPFWDDLRTGPRGVCFAVTGEAPDRVLWITWKEACFASGDDDECDDPALAAELGTLTFTVALEETTDRIYAGYQQMAAALSNADRAKGLSATIGITTGGARGCPATECSSEGTCTNGAPCGYTQYSSRSVVALPTLELQPR